MCALFSWNRKSNYKHCFSQGSTWFQVSRFWLLLHNQIVFFNFRLIHIKTVRIRTGWRKITWLIEINCPTCMPCIYPWMLHLKWNCRVYSQSPGTSLMMLHHFKIPKHLIAIAYTRAQGLPDCSVDHCLFFCDGVANPALRWMQMMLAKICSHKRKIRL